jgi:copper chaperone CopZ
MSMRLLACLFALAACQRADSAERSAELVANTPPKPAVAVTAAPTPAPTPEPAHHSCGCGGGGQCGGQCGASCGGGEAPAWTTPDTANWTALHVTGMHCGGCARRIERALAGVKGVLGVKADYSTAKVEIATADGVDAKKLVTSTIDGLGYRVE